MIRDGAGVTHGMPDSSYDMAENRYRSQLHAVRIIRQRAKSELLHLKVRNEVLSFVIAELLIQG